MSQNFSPPKEEFPAETVLAEQGGSSLQVIVLLSGTVSLTREVHGTRATVMGMEGNGFIGLPEALLGRPYWCTYTAITPVRVMRYTVAGFFEAMRSSKLENVTMKILARWVGMLIDQVMDLAIGPPPALPVVTGEYVPEQPAEQPTHVISGATPVEGLPASDDGAPGQEVAEDITRPIASGIMSERSRRRSSTLAGVEVATKEEDLGLPVVIFHDVEVEEK